MQFSTHRSHFDSLVAGLSVFISGSSHIKGKLRPLNDLAGSAFIFGWFIIRITTQLDFQEVLKIAYKGSQ